MIEPVVSGETLWECIECEHPEPYQATIWWFGQSGYAIKTSYGLFYIDLYLSEHLTIKYANTDKPHVRMTRAPIQAENLRAGKYVFASHKHSDHLDPGTIPALFTANPEIKLVLPLALIDYAMSLGLEHERLIPMRGNDTIDIDGIVVHALPSSHPNFDYEESRGHGFLGFVFEFDGVRMYHSGDTVVYPELVERLKAIQPDLAFLPINGAQAAGTPPNMSAEDAVTLAKEIGGRTLIIPHHYDMFTFNTVDVRNFMTLAERAGIPYRVLQCGERFLFDARHR